MTLLLAVLLSVLLILPADGRRFEWVRAMHDGRQSLWSVLPFRLATTALMAALMALGTGAWANAGPAGELMLVFGGVMAATWLWMWFWIRTYVADPGHPLLVLGPTAVILGSGLSFTLWLVVFTLQALVAAWSTEVGWGQLWSLSLLWAALDTIWLGVLGRHPAGYRYIQSERQQRRVGRVSGSLVMALAIWAVIVAAG